MGGRRRDANTRVLVPSLTIQWQGRGCRQSAFPFDSTYGAEHDPTSPPFPLHVPLVRPVGAGPILHSASPAGAPHPGAGQGALSGLYIVDRRGPWALQVATS